MSNRAFISVLLLAILIMIAVFSMLNRPGIIFTCTFPVTASRGSADASSDDKYLLRLDDKSSFTKQMENKTGRKFPDAIIIGVQKCGTRVLINMLKSHPDVLGPSKEVDYFSVHYIKGMEWYLNLMPRSTSNRTVIIEKSPSYFAPDYVPMLIYRDQPKPTKIILIVRNPVDRALSYYAHRTLVSKIPTPKFETYVTDKDGEINAAIIDHREPNLLSMGWYDVHFQQWLKWFNRSEILVLDGEQLIKDPVMILKKAEKFLKLKSYFRSEMFVENHNKKGFYCWNKDRNKQNIKNKQQPTCLGKSKGLPHPVVRKSVITKLHQYYNLHVTKFYDLASVNFTWCNL